MCQLSLRIRNQKFIDEMRSIGIPMVASSNQPKYPKSASAWAIVKHGHQLGELATTITKDLHNMGYTQFNTEKVIKMLLQLDESVV